MVFTGHAVGWIRQSSDAQHSIESQVCAFELFCERNDFNRVTTIEFVGSAMDDNPATFFDAMRKQGIRAYDDLHRMLEARDIDVLWAIDSTRFGRAKWLINHVIEFTVAHGAVTYADGIGVINPDNFDAMVAISSIGSQADVKRLHGSRAIQTRRNKADKGIPATGVIPWTHERRFDGYGTLIGVDIRDSARVAMGKLGDLLLAGESYRECARLMTADGFDHFSKHHYVRRIAFHPMMFGHMPYKFRDKPQGEWLFEAGHHLPDGAYVAYNVIEPIWGERTPQIIVELKARLSANGGRGSRAEAVNPFYKLVHCASCGAYMNYAKVQSRGYSWEYLRCQKRCEGNPSFTRLDVLKRWMTEAIETALQNGVLLVGNDNNRLELWQAQVKRAEADILTHERQLEGLAIKEIERPDMSHIYVKQIDKKRAQLKSMLADLNLLKANRPYDTQRELDAMERIKKLDVSKLWGLDNAVVNQVLRDAMGQARLYIQEYDLEIRLG